jgi:hypothetical protein
MSSNSDIFQLSDVGDLPAELVEKLKATKRDSLETRLIELYQLAGRELTLDEVLVGFFRKYNEILDRRVLINKLYTMARAVSPAIESVPERKGVYVIRRGFAHTPSSPSPESSSPENIMGEEQSP